MRFMLGFAICAFAFASPSDAASVDVVKRYISLVRSGDVDSAGSLMAPKLIWANQNYPQGREVVPGAYGLYLTISDIKVGSIVKVKCRALDENDVSCTFTRQSMFGGGRSDVVENYTVAAGKIAKVTDTVPAAMLSLGAKH